MNGKRVRSKSCARACKNINIHCEVGALPERPQGTILDARSPNNIALLCYAVLCYASLLYAMIFYAIVCYCMLCYTMQCYATLCYAMLG